MSEEDNNKEFNTKIKYDGTEYIFSLISSSNILQVFLYKEGDIDKYKSFFTYERLLRRSNALSRISSNIQEAAGQIFSAVSMGNYFLKINYSKSYLIFRITFSGKEDRETINPIKSLLDNLEIFLYKTDSKQYDSKIDSIKSEIEKLNLENEELRTQSIEDLENLEKLLNENEELKKQYDELNHVTLNKVEKDIENLKEAQESNIEEIEIKLKKLKQDLIINYEKPRVIKEKLHLFMPIMTYQEKNEVLKKWFKCEFELVLAYDSMVDGDESTEFHNKCDGKIQTLTLIETQQGRRFGGFTKLFWDHSESFKSDDEGAFIFSLDKKTKYNCSDQSKVIYCSNKQGPTFGKGPDIFISDKFLTNNSSSCIKGSYGEKDDIDPNYTKTTFLAGIEIFKVKRIEVYQVIFK